MSAPNAAGVAKLIEHNMLMQQQMQESMKQNAKLAELLLNSSSIQQPVANPNPNPVAAPVAAPIAAPAPAKSSTSSSSSSSSNSSKPTSFQIPSDEWEMGNRKGYINQLLELQIKPSEGIDEGRDNSLTAGATGMVERYALIPVTNRYDIISADNGCGMLIDRLKEMLQTNSDLLKESNANVAGTSIFGIGVWNYIVSMLDINDPKDYVQITTTTKNSSQIIRCTLFLGKFYYSATRQPPDFSYLDQNAHPTEVSNFLQLIKECNDVADSNANKKPLDCCDTWCSGDPFATNTNASEDVIDGFGVISNGSSINLSEISGTVIKFNAGTFKFGDCTKKHKNHTKKCEFESTVSNIITEMLYTYRFPSFPYLPIVIQSERNGSFIQYKNRHYIEPDNEMAVLKVEILRSGQFKIVHLKEGVTLKKKGRIVSKKDTVFGKTNYLNNLHKVVEAAYAVFQKGSLDNLKLEANGSNPYFVLRLCFDHKHGLQSSTAPISFQNHGGGKKMTKQLRGYLSTEINKNNAALPRHALQGFRVFGPIGVESKGERMFGKLVPIMPQTTLFGKHQKSFELNGIHSHYTYKDGRFLRAELLVSPSIQLARLVHVESVKSRSKPLAMNNAGYQPTFAKIVMSLWKSMLPNQTKGKKERVALFENGRVKWPYKTTSSGSGNNSSNSNNGSSSSSSSNSSNNNGGSSSSSSSAGSQKKSPTMSSKKRKRKTKPKPTSISVAKAEAKEIKSVNKARIEMMKQCHRQSISFFKKTFKVKLSNKDATCLEMLKKMKQNNEVALEKEQEKQISSISSKDKSVSTIEDEARKKRKKFALNLVPKGTQVEGFFSDLITLVHPSPWFSGTVKRVGKDSAGKIDGWWVRYEGDATDSFEPFQYETEDIHFLEPTYDSRQFRVVQDVVPGLSHNLVRMASSSSSSSAALPLASSSPSSSSSSALVLHPTNDCDACNGKHCSHTCGNKGSSQIQVDNDEWADWMETFEKTNNNEDIISKAELLDEARRLKHNSTLSFTVVKNEFEKRGYIYDSQMQKTKNKIKTQGFIIGIKRVTSSSSSSSFSLKQEPNIHVKYRQELASKGWTIVENQGSHFKYTSPDGKETFSSVKAVKKYLSRKRKATSNNEVERSSKKKKTTGTTSSSSSLVDPIKREVDKKNVVTKIKNEKSIYKFLYGVKGYLQPGRRVMVHVPDSSGVWSWSKGTIAGHVQTGIKVQWDDSTFPLTRISHRDVETCIREMTAEEK